MCNSCGSPRRSLWVIISQQFLVLAPGFANKAWNNFIQALSKSKRQKKLVNSQFVPKVSRFMFSPPRPLDQLHYCPVLLNFTLKEMMMCGIFSLKTNILHGMQEILQPGWRRLLHLFIANITMGCNKTYDCHHTSGSGFHMKPLKPKVK